jgi:hypothetical protein
MEYIDTSRRLQVWSVSCIAKQWILRVANRAAPMSDQKIVVDALRGLNCTKRALAQKIGVSEAVIIRASNGQTNLREVNRLKVLKEHLDGLREEQSATVERLHALNGKIACLVQQIANEGE